MKKYATLLVLISIFSACNKTNDAIKTRIENADSVAINYFKGDGSMDTVVAIKIISDKEVLAQLVSQISATSTNTSTTCGIDGSLHFFKMNRVVQDIDFVMNEKECNLFSFKMTFGGPLSFTKLSPKAKELLVSLKQK